MISMASPWRPAGPLERHLAALHADGDGVGTLAQHLPPLLLLQLLLKPVQNPLGWSLE